jgi:hypothetical protein
VHALIAAALLLYQADAQAQRLPAGPGQYFQQGLHYTMAARLDEPAGVLAGSGRMWYRNNSPDTLTTMPFHLYLNAFRPGSRWAARETAENGRSWYAILPDPYYAYERLGRVAIGGRAVEARYPGAPDSTVVEFTLPAPLAPGDSTVVDLEWRSRPSVVPRRQGRRGRRYDFAQWYPEVAVYDRFGWETHPLYPEGEFFGEYGSYDVTLDLMADQVCGATGVPVEGDPGWGAARATPETAVTLQRDWYGADTLHPTPYPLTPGPTSSAPGGRDAGRKQVRFRAENVEHFAFSCNPDYVYEEGRYGGTVIHALYLPGDSLSWGRGVAVARTARALEWLDRIYGPYAWPQATVLHRIEDGGTEFPMMVMLGGAGESLIFHEIGHLYTYGILGNNEWKEGWLDEGFTTFQTGWNFQQRGMGVPSQRTQMLILALDLDGWSQPVVLSAEDYRDYGTYSRMIYTKGQLICEMLRYVLGEATFERVLREYYARYRFTHVTSERFAQVAEEVSHQDLSWFFAEWLHGAPLVDYGLRKVRRRQTPEGWVTDIEIERLGDGIMPVDIAVPVGDSTVIVRARGVERRETVEVRTATKPGHVELDPARQTMDWNYLNNVEGAHLPFARSVGRGLEEAHFGWAATTPAARDRLVVNWLPLAWFDDAGGLTLGLQSRSNYLGRFELNQAQVTWPTGTWAGSARAGGRWRPDYYASLRNPVASRAPRRQTELASWSVEGRTGERLAASQDLSRHVGGDEHLEVGTALTLMAVTDARYLERSRWADTNTAEWTTWAERVRSGDGASLRSRLELAAGEAFSLTPRPGVLPPCAFPGCSPGERLLHGAPYARGLVESRRAVSIGALELRLRAVAAGTLGGNAVPVQRRIFLAGADPYETFTNPFLRSRGSLFARTEAHYQAPGGGGLRGFGPSVTASWLVGLGVEAGWRLADRPQRRLFSTVTVAAFADGALLDPHAIGRAAAGDAGIGLRAAHRIGPTSFVTRVDVPLLVTRPAVAVAGAARDGVMKFRWVWSLEEAF